MVTRIVAHSIRRLLSNQGCGVDAMRLVDAGVISAGTAKTFLDSVEAMNTEIKNWRNANPLRRRKKEWPKEFPKGVLYDR